MTVNFWWFLIVVLWVVGGALSVPRRTRAFGLGCLAVGIGVLVSLFAQANY